MRRLFLTACAASLLGLAGCSQVPRAAEPSTVSLALSRAWVDGKQVAYITTDASDAKVAAQMGANFVPRLADALPSPGRPALLERVYAFEGAEQISIFQSAPSPAGAANADKAYTPLWRMVVVRWVKTNRWRELRSEEALLAAEEQGDVTLEVTPIVVNCAIIRSADGTAIGAVR